MVSRSATQGQVTCPQCEAVCILPSQGPEALSTNVYVLNNVKMETLMKNQQYVLL